MSFKQSDIDKLLVGCHRRCCVCHRFCGFKMEVHHIEWKSKKGSDDIKNGIPLCFECHAEVAFYNPEHPKGRKYTNSELLGHKKQWLLLSKQKPEILVGALRDKEVGPLEGMILELEYNLEVAKLAEGAHPQNRIGSSLKFTQYEKAISEGAIMLLSEDVKKKLTTAYMEIIRANNLNETCISVGPTGSAYERTQTLLFNALRNNISTIMDAINSLKDFLVFDKDK